MASKDLNGKTAIVTGATSGIGLETAKALAGRGAKVILGVRNLTAAQDVVKGIKTAHPDADVEVGPALDLLSQNSVREFAASLAKRGTPINILVNNAGVSYMKKCFTEEGVGGIVQTNYLGPYTLTRLLEKQLVAGKARVVNVASVVHRTTTIRDPQGFLTDWRQGYYEHSKLGNVLFAYELQRRLGNLGVTSCATDPGGVRSSIWDKSPKFSQGFLRRIIDNCYAPPCDGAASTVYAATVAWEKDRKTQDGKPVMPAQDLRYYARGLFALPSVCMMDGISKGVGFGQKVTSWIWNISALCASLSDWPLRNLSKGALASKTSAFLPTEIPL